jgi:protein-arginine deiminase
MIRKEFVLKNGQRERFYFNVQDDSIVLSEQSKIEVYYVKEGHWEPLTIGVPVKAPLPYEGLFSCLATGEGSGIARIEHRDSGDNVKETLLIDAAIIRLALIVDADRDGTVGAAETGVANWVWGRNQRGAVIIVNNDRDVSELHPDTSEQSELASIVVPSTLVDKLPDGYRLVLMSTQHAARRFSIYRQKSNGSLERILGCDPKARDSSPITQSPPLNLTGEHCFVEAHEFPGSFFEGLITIKLGLIDDSGVEISA